jgi:hypothetical protein
MRIDELFSDSGARVQNGPCLRAWVGVDNGKYLRKHIPSTAGSFIGATPNHYNHRRENVINNVQSSENGITGSREMIFY